MISVRLGYGEALEHVGRVRTIVLDKTSIIPRGHPVVTDIAAGAMAFSSVFVVTNSLRLRKARV